jgi:TRAP-type uncharacterized transport system substrate-binding protein
MSRRSAESDGRAGLPEGTAALPHHRLLNRPTLLLIAALFVLTVAGLFLVRDLNRATYQLTMTTGSFSGANYALATRYLVPGAKAQGVEISMVPTGGSVDTLDAVQMGRVQVAITDGGLGLQARDNVREVAPLFLTALHVLMRSEIYDQMMETRDLRAAFKGKTISMSNEGSGTRLMALKELSRLGISTADFTEVPRTVNFLVDPNTTDDMVPDVVFAASLLPSPIAARLVRDFNYRLLPLDFVDAVRLEDKSAYGVTIPAATYGLSPDVPDRTVVTLGRRLLLIANKDVPDDAITALTRAVFDSDFAKAYEPALTPAQFDLLPEFPRHAGAQAYVSSHLPITHETFERLFQAVGVAGAVACIPPCIIMMQPFLRRRRQRANGRSVRDYIAAVSDLEAEAFLLDDPHPRSHGTLIDIRRRLSHLKLEAMDAYKRDLLDDGDLMDSLLAHIADLSNHLNAFAQTSRLRSDAEGHELARERSASGSSKGRTTRRPSRRTPAAHDRLRTGVGRTVLISRTNGQMEDANVAIAGR